MLKKSILSLVLILLTATGVHAKMVSVNRDKVNMRSGPGTNYSVLWELGRGYPLMVKETKGSWYRVVDFQGDEGWIFKKLVARKAYVIVKKKVINIRSGPGTEYKIVAKANHGVVFRTLKRGGGWLKVKHEDGLEGWVYRNLVWGW